MTAPSSSTWWSSAPGLAGIYSLYHLHDLGSTLQVIETSDVAGGTWYWNRYPGTRCDVPSLEYSYGFSKELQQEWEWTEIMPAREEIEEYLNHVVDRFDLRGDIKFGTTHGSPPRPPTGRTRWLVDTEAATTSGAVPRHGDRMPLRAARPKVEGRDSSRAVAPHPTRGRGRTSTSPASASGLVGTGSSGVQAMPDIAREWADLYVFQRTPGTRGPRGIGSPELQQRVKANTTTGGPTTENYRVRRHAGSVGALPRDLGHPGRDAGGAAGGGRRVGLGGVPGVERRLRDSRRTSPAPSSSGR